jgi:uncharacterized protein
LDEKKNIETISEDLGIKQEQIKNTVKLLDDDNTVPFIARYRKEVTGSLNEDQILNIKNLIRYYRKLMERKKQVLKSIEDQGKLTPELKEKIEAATKLQEVEDLYLPYKPKRRTRATIAREKGLEPLAELILKQEILSGNPQEIAAEYINQEKGVETADDALAGARDIAAENISENAEIRNIMRKLAFVNGLIISKAKDMNILKEYEIYQDFSEPVKTIKPHRILAMNRGEKENILRISIDTPEDLMTNEINRIIVTNTDSIFTDELKRAILDSYGRLIWPAIEREVRNQLTELADEHAIKIFVRNLRAYLMTPPFHDKIILGIDPGFRTGCKLAVIDTTGKYLQGATIYPHEPQKQWDKAKETITNIINTHQVDVIAIGNGTACRETEKLVAEAIGEIEQEILYSIVNEAGASVYSASNVARTEFPDLEASMRGNISIARRLLDPLSELVKIDPKSIGVGMYQHDVNQIKLSEALDSVVESCVNAVGVDLNTASVSLLKYVSGIKGRIAENIVKYREEHGKFSSREELKKVKGLGKNSFVQAAGFLRIYESDIFFDSTAVHPESYSTGEKLLDHLKLNMNQIKEDGSLIRQQIKSVKFSIEELSARINCGRETLTDIIYSLEKSNRDPRDQIPKPFLRSDVLKLDDLREGMILKGTVRNVIDFGIFVDIGVKRDGLVHISQIANRFIKHPLDVVTVGDIVDVKVISINRELERIGLSMILEN